MVGGGNGSALQSAVCGRIGRERTAEAGEIDVGHGDSDRIHSGRVLRQVVEGQHRFLVELPAQRLGEAVQRGLVGNAEMEFVRPLGGGLLQVGRPIHAVEWGGSRRRGAVLRDGQVGPDLEQRIGVVAEEQLRRLTVRGWCSSGSPV